MIRLLFIWTLLFTSPAAFSAEITDEKCLDCHGVKGYSVPEGKHGEGPKRLLDVNYEAMQESLHGKLSCVECHSDIKKLPHKYEKLQTVDCVQCHEQLDPVVLKKKRQGVGRVYAQRRDKPHVLVQTINYQQSIHADSSVKDNASCSSCHSSHYVFQSSDSRALNHRENSPEMCGECHPKALKEYKKSVHGAALKTPWKGESATCSDCHSSHEISTAKDLTAHRLVTKNCGDCHEKEVRSYMSTTHGQLAWLGDDKVARCVDCHRGHDTHEIDNPESMVSQQNILETCRECHEDANEKIVGYHPHGNTREFDKYPSMYVVGKLMVWIVVIVLIFFYTHSVLWFYREYKNRVVKWYVMDSKSVPVHVKPKKKHSDQHFQRFTLLWRLNHWALAVSVMVLTLTGMAVMYSDTAWAVIVVDATGGPEVFGIIHRVAGVIFLVAVFGHAIVVLKKLLAQKDFDWFGPDSLLPRWKDWDDMKAMFRWFFGRGEAPKLDRWTYWEKFDYWAVYWGALVIGLSGIILWASPTLLKYLPGWAFNVAAIAHGVEAFLAVATLFVVHFFNNHFRPEKFPLDIVMFTGSWDLEEFKEERPLEYERLLASGELEKYLVKPPSKRFNIIAHILGFTLLAIGVLLLIMVMIGFSQRGLF